MVMMMTLKYVDELSGGRKRFRRRYPKVVAEVMEASFFQVPMKAREGAALVAEQEALLAEFEKIVEKAKRKAAGQGKLSPVEHWREAVKEAEELVAGVKGSLSEADKREVLAESLQQDGADPTLIKAVSDPNNQSEYNPEPPVTMLDAKEMYRKERMNGAEGRNQKNRLERVCRRVETALGPLHKLALVDLKREHARELRDSMLATKKRDGSLLSPSSVRRELDMIRAMVSLAITEYDLQGKAYNPFEGLEVVMENSAPETEWDKRDPLPRDVILSMRERMNGKLRKPALGLIWRLLEGTGCRGAEIVGLRSEDVCVDCAHPHIRVMWHEERRVKTKVSIRSVPLVGDALEAAKEALKLAGGERMLFSDYAYEGGPDAVSQALMKHLRKFTKNKRHVVYSLRHNMKDLLILAKVPERDEHLILGHSLGGVGNRVYGGGETKLKVATEAMHKAIALAP
ncbi:tyrosine-type recombinase/integrase [Aliiroseovarius crassostreae]|uniref:tyrosine-type recombinase/integrase n=1 Tax=Aliiroseovarius crassostreae TaxID=154981 RepID=UPI0021AF1469|nr:tyrosine-type recombinase/integrase [Aliiroseovarius crassostreae]UWP91405.1 tyrosine-type recombinase/integrase [Aliiroseovarius crassostreae]